MNKSEIKNINDFLIRLKENGNKDLVKGLYFLVQPSLQHIALKYLRNTFDAEDICQEFWGNIYKYANKYIYPMNGFNYLCKIMTNITINRYHLIKNTNERIQPIYVDYSKMVGSSTLTVEEIEKRQLVEYAFTSLTNTEKIIIQSIFYENKTTREIAKELDISIGLVSKLKKSALLKMKDKLS